jgi:tetratricopeptide (TPR) repeat protein
MKGQSKDSKRITFSALKLLEHQIQTASSAMDWDQCIHLLGQVLKINPRSANAHLSIGKIHGMRYEYDEALEWFEKAVEVSPRKQHALVLIEAGRMAKDFYDPAISESLYEEALEVARNTKGRDAMVDAVDAKIALAEHFLRSRKRDPAKAIVDEVLGANPKDWDAWLLWCRLNEGQFDRCVERLELLLQSEAGGELKVRASYQLAKILDQAADYDGAMRVLVRAKANMMSAREAIVTHRRKIRGEFKELAEAFISSKRAEWQAAMSDLGEPKNLALLGGHPRSGTTLLEQVLDAHPGVVSAEETENLHIFSFTPLLRQYSPLKRVLEIMNACSNKDLVEGRENYWESMERCLQEPVGSRLLVDKNPSLTPLAPEFFRFFPETRFLIMIRDPRDVILSCFMMPSFPPNAISGNFLTLEDTTAEVGSFMSLWAEISESFEGNVCEVRYEEMVEDLEGNARKVLDFLDLEWSESVMEYDRHARGKVVRSPTADAVTEKVHSRAKARWKNYEKYLEPYFDKLSGCLSAFGYE